MSNNWRDTLGDVKTSSGNPLSKMLKIGGGIFLFIFAWTIIAGSIVIVESGYVGVVTHFGAVQEGVLPEGMHFVMPIQTKVVPINVRVQKVEEAATASSKDLQNVTSKVALNYYLSKEAANTIFQELGINYRANIIEPTIQESIKSITSRYTAEELITRRPDVKKDVFEDIKKRLQQNNIIVTDFSIVDFNFSAEFNKAIEAKQIAEQRALTAKNDLRRIETEALQDKARAEGEAQAMLAKARAQAEAQELLARSLNDRLLELKAIEKWDGIMPVVMGEGNSSFIDLGGKVMKGKK